MANAGQYMASAIIFAFGIFVIAVSLFNCATWIFTICVQRFTIYSWLIPALNYVTGLLMEIIRSYNTIYNWA